MKILNPDFTAPARPLDARRADVLGVFAALSDQRVVSFDDVRGKLKLTKEQLPDAWIHQIADDAGLKVWRE